MVRALVISVGGSKGAFAGGLAEYLIRICKHDYKIFIGSSTGSLLVDLGLYLFGSIYEFGDQKRQ